MIVYVGAKEDLRSVWESVLSAAARCPVTAVAVPTMEPAALSGLYLLS